MSKRSNQPQIKFRVCVQEPDVFFKTTVTEIILRFRVRQPLRDAARKSYVSINIENTHACKESMFITIIILQ